MTSSALKIVPASPSDFEEMWPVMREVFSTDSGYAHLPDTTRESARAYFMGPGSTAYIARDDAGSLLGFFRLAPVHVGRGSHIATASFMVASGRRNAGVGRALTSHALRRAAEAGYKAMRFNNVVSFNHAAIVLYLKMEFKIVGTVPEAYRRLQTGEYADVYVMHRSLHDIVSA